MPKRSVRSIPIDTVAFYIVTVRREKKPKQTDQRIESKSTMTMQDTVTTEQTSKDVTYTIIVRLKIFGNFSFTRKTSRCHVRRERKGTVTFVAVLDGRHGLFCAGVGYYGTLLCLLRERMSLCDSGERKGAKIIILYI